MGKSSWGIILIMLVVFGTGFYYHLGGFNPVRILLKDCDGVKLIGINYRGTPQDEKLGQSFKKIEDLITENPGADMHTVYFTEPSGKGDTMHVFVGVPQMDVKKVNLNFDEISFNCKQALVAIIVAHRWVMPAPSKVKREIEKEADRLGVSLHGVFIDRIISEDKVEVLAPVK